MTEWPEYTSVKYIRAALIVRLHTSPDAAASGALLVQHEDGTTEDFTPTVAAMMENTKVGDYAILYKDGYRSVMPAAVFHESCSAAGDILVAYTPEMKEKMDEFANILEKDNAQKEAAQAQQTPVKEQTKSEPVKTQPKVEESKVEKKDEVKKEVFGDVTPPLPPPSDPNNVHRGATGDGSNTGTSSSG